MLNTNNAEFNRQSAISTMIKYSIKSKIKFYYDNNYQLLFRLGIYRLQIKMRLFVELRLDQHTVGVYAGISIIDDNMILLLF